MYARNDFLDCFAFYGQLYGLERILVPRAKYSLWNSLS